MKAIAWLADVDQDDDLELRRWLLAALVIVAIHAALLAAHLWWPAQNTIAGADAPPLLIDFAPEAAAPELKADLAPDKEESIELQAAVQKQEEQKVEEKPVVEEPPIQTPIRKSGSAEAGGGEGKAEGRDPEASGADPERAPADAVRAGDHLQSEPGQSRAEGRGAHSRRRRCAESAAEASRSTAGPRTMAYSLGESARKRLSSSRLPTTWESLPVTDVKRSALARLFSTTMGIPDHPKRLWG